MFRWFVMTPGLAGLILFGAVPAPGAVLHSTIEVSQVRICWDSASNLIYQVQYRNHSGKDAEDPWRNLGEPVRATGSRTCVTDDVQEPRRFYRVVGPDLVWIPPGPLSGNGEPSVTTPGFWMGRYEVTQEQYREVTGTNPSFFRDGQLPPFVPGQGGAVSNEWHHPVEQVNWFEATNFCAQLTEQERTAGRLPQGFVYRLPTSAEWEYACRAGSTTAFHYGNALRSGMANFNGINEFDALRGTEFNPDGEYIGRTREVGRYQPNAWGLYDMHGNVWEWTQDSTRAGLDDSSTESYRIIRGGGWSNDGWICQSAFRGKAFPLPRQSGVGLRVVLGMPH